MRRRELMLLLGGVSTPRTQKVTFIAHRQFAV
jgi:hypothetical protein